jgi:octaprenyl-diphosphate synthase
VELIHTASLLHDDVVDETKKRRGKKTANSIWGNKETILIGDYLFTESFTTMVKLNEMRAIEIIADASSKLTQGEITQLENERNIMLSVDEYLNIIYYKTASLFEASAKLGALFASDANIDLCAEFGKNLGFAFQIMDDILDYKGSLMMGKDAGNDFQERKITLPMIFLLNAVSASKREEIIRYFHNNGDFSFKEIQKLMQENGIFEKSQEFMNIFIKNASSFVNGLYNQEVKKLLMILIDFFIHRVL